MGNTYQTWLSHHIIEFTNLTTTCISEHRIEWKAGMEGGIVLFHKYYYLVFIEQQSSAASVEKMNGQIEFLFVLNMQHSLPPYLH